MDVFTAIILGVVEGLTEFLPISSTGHLILATKLLNITQTDFVKSFEIAIQLGAILSIIVLYWKQFLLNLKVLKKIFVAFVPTGVIGVIFYKMFKQSLLGNEQIVLWSLFLGGIFIIAFEFFYRKKRKTINSIAEIPYKKCFLIGIFQSFSIIPGVSRAAATIIGGLSLRLNRETIVQFSFFLAVPTLLAASGYDLINSAGQFSFGQLDLLAVGFIASFFVALATVKLFLNFAKKNNFIPFGIYRIILALAFWFLIFS